MVIAIDGPAGAGKSTVARAVAEELGITYLDSGAMYRCVALLALREDVPLDDPDAVAEVASQAVIVPLADRVELDGRDVSDAIRGPEVTLAASRVAVHPPVRDAMVERQRELIEADDYVAEGRDIGTVVSPDSPLKVFLTAAPEERARRRAAESGGDESEILAQIRERDARDEGREQGALKRADDAVEIDTTGLGIDEVVGRITELARERDLA